MQEQSIYLIKPSTLTLDKYYKVFMTETTMIFVKLGGQFYEKNAVEEQYFIYGKFISLLRNKIFAKRRSVFEAKVDQEFEMNPNALLTKRSNFKLELNDLKGIQVSDKPTFHSGWNDNGSVKITLASGKIIKLQIPKSVSTNQVFDMFKSKNLPIQHS